MVPGCGTDVAARTVRMWLKSPGHRANLLNPAFRWVGAGAASDADCSAPSSPPTTAARPSRTGPPPARQAWKHLPQPQEAEAFGLLMRNPAPWKPSS